MKENVLCKCTRQGMSYLHRQGRAARTSSQPSQLPGVGHRTRISILRQAHSSYTTQQAGPALIPCALLPAHSGASQPLTVP